ncbi:hypothetical protein D3C81_1730010 [compost metagenome]
MILWRERWINHYPQLCLTKHEHPEELEDVIIQVLRERPRPGTPTTFTGQQILQIVAIACEDPKAYGRPVSHWTPRGVRDEVIKRGIVPTISVRQVGRFLK